MNDDDDFEKKLHSFTRALHRPDPTATWKSAILSRAMSESDAAQSKRTPRPPRWLMVTWGAAWALIIVLHLASPQLSTQNETSPAVATALDTNSADSQTLFAYNRQLSLSLDLP